MRAVRIRMITAVAVFLLIGTNTPPIVAVALTKEAVSTTTDKSTSESISDPSNETADEVTESSVKSMEERIVEATYEDRELEDTLEGTSIHPIVQLDEKKLEDSLKVKGRLTLQNEELNKKIHLKKVALQTKSAGEEWIEKKDFEIYDSFELGENDFSFDYEEEIKEEQEIRLIIEYDLMDRSNESTTMIEKHKGSYQIGETSKSEVEHSTQGPVLETPNYSVASRVAQLRGTRAVSDVVYNGTEYQGYTNQVKFHSIKSREAKINFLRADSSSFLQPSSKVYAVYSTDVNFVYNNRGSPSGVQLQPEEWTTLKAAAPKILLTSNDSGTNYIKFGDGTFTNLEPNKTYYVWLFKLINEGLSIEFVQGFALSGTSTYVGSPKYEYTPYKFTTDSPMALTLTAPTFTQTSATATSVPMVGKTYTGDIFQTNTQGKVQVTSNDGTNILDKVTNLGHQKTQGGTYNSVTVSGLVAGTRYKGRVAIKDYGGAWKYSGWSGYFYTPNTVNQPSIPTLNTPTAYNNATAAISATYNAGNVAANPTATEVQISTNNTSWTTINTGTTPATTNPAINTSTKAVTFTLSKLNSKTKYYVRYRVKNASNIWSSYSTSREFTTKGIPLSISTPTFNQSTATTTTISMNSGTYTGDISQTTNNGIVYTESYNSGSEKDWTTKISNLVHQTSTGGTYNGATITGLNPGTRYRGWVNLKNYESEGLTSNSSQYFYTANAVEQPASPTLNNATLNNNATAEFTATYQAAGQHATQVAAHPSSVEVQYSTNNTNWITINSGTTPSVSVPVIEQNTKKVSFTLSKLNTKTKYYVRYRVHTEGVVWSSYSASREFATKGIQPDISPPIFTQTTASPTSIFMESGTYTGDLSDALNHGVIQTESYNFGGEKDWTASVTNLTHDPNFKTYASSWVNGLNPGTRYRGWVAFKDYGTDGTNGTYIYKERTNLNGTSYYFYTTNSIENLTEPDKGIPTTVNNATATFTATYQAAGQHAAQVAAHPTKVKVFVSTDGTTYEEVTTNSSEPKLVSDDDIDTLTKSITFKLGGLRENTRYFVKYSVINEGGESPESSVYDFVTLGRANGFYLNEVPDHFNFGVINTSSNQLSQPLSNTVGESIIDFENININTQWSLSAKLSELKADGEEHLTLTGSSILLSKQLKKTPDSGGSWFDADENKFDSGIGTNGSITLPADDSTSVSLFKTTDIPYGQGYFRAMIPLDSVKLLIPGNVGEKGKNYTGKITWTLDTTL
ncbi:hypothetical protein P7E02_05260 [Enterococcus hulanensis]|uniref:hypothetical protein n=1 Tax=Enterococcus hulanensis TaxID=2559929 RepID=UPI00288D5083|nr:hypothetical protein [Enterococcus hulanensis]MDT2659265.1 hypothetical protein [Enterococcus hulanensis]